MKKFWKIAKFVLVGLLMLVTFAYMSCHVYYEWNLWYASELEIVCYAIWLIGFAMCFYAIVDRLERLWAKIAAGTVTSLLYTTVVFLGNNFWKYISINNDFNWEDPFLYSDILRWDIGYTYDYGWLRYPLVFAIMFVICGAKILWTRPRVKIIRESLGARIGYWLYIMELKQQSFGELYFDVVEDNKEDKLFDYVDSMPLNEKNKKMLMRFIDVKKDPYLIYLLFWHFEELITAEEYAHYRNLYVEITEARIKAIQEYYATAKVEFTPPFKRLDDKFGITDDN